MCLYPKLMINKKYLSNKKNGGNPPVLLNNKVKYVPVSCGECIECRKKKSRDWSLRMQEEIKMDLRGFFVTLTFDNEHLEKYRDAVIEAAEGEYIIDDNMTATIAVRRFLERWRKKYKKSVKHWLVTELGHNGTERIHLHGIIWTDFKYDIEKIWQNGWVYLGDYVNEKTINYIVKYITKIDNDHEDFTPKVLCSKGIGSSYIDSYDGKLNKYKESETKENYTFKNGVKVSLPVYYRNKIYTDDQKEELWIKKIDKHERWVLGTKVDVSTSSGIDKFNNLVKQARVTNKKMGYGEPVDKAEKIYQSRMREINRNSKNFKD